MSAEGLLEGRVRSVRRQQPGTLAAMTAQATAASVPVADPGVYGLTVILALLAGVVFVVTDADGQRADAAIWFQAGLESLLVLTSAWLVHRSRRWFV
ncbi:MAG: hypothetical protein ACKOEO_03645, partial [Planctomycetaceae bacterium]